MLFSKRKMEEIHNVDGRTVTIDFPKVGILNKKGVRSTILVFCETDPLAKTFPFLTFKFIPFANQSDFGAVQLDTSNNYAIISLNVNNIGDHLAETLAHETLHLYHMREKNMLAIDSESFIHLNASVNKALSKIQGDSIEKYGLSYFRLSFFVFFSKIVC